jgi:hypothetical protein
MILSNADDAPDAESAIDLIPLGESGEATAADQFEIKRLDIGAPGTPTGPHLANESVAAEGRAAYSAPDSAPPT